jgi:hypothetical protein
MVSVALDHVDLTAAATEIPVAAPIAVTTIAVLDTYTGAAWPDTPCAEAACGSATKA